MLNRYEAFIRERRLFYLNVNETNKTRSLLAD